MILGIGKESPKQAAGLGSFADDPLTVTIPIAKDDLDFVAGATPPHVHIAAWKR